MKRNLAVLALLFMAGLLVLQVTMTGKSLDAKYYVNLGNQLGMEGNHSKVIDAFKKALEIDLDHVPAYLGLGTAYGNSGRNKEAIEVFKQGIQLDPNHASVPQMQLNIASIAHDMNDGNTAVKYAKKALQSFTDQGDYAGVSLMGQKLKQFDTIYSESEINEKESGTQ